MRIFQEHKLRAVESLDGLWQLKTTRGDYTAYVPGVWERIPELTTYRGQATYRRRVTVSEAGCVLLRFGGVSHTANVSWDGKAVAHHYNAFTGFEVLLENVAAGEHTLEVLVDNAYGEHSTLHIPNDYFTYGGINRPVELHSVSGAYIERLAFHATENADGSFHAHVRVWVQALMDVNDASVQMTVADARASAPLPKIAAGETVFVDLGAPVGKVQRWDVLCSHLYDLTATLFLGGSAVDDLIDRVGFRTVVVKDERILLNGRPVFLKGFNRHRGHEPSSQAGVCRCEAHLSSDRGQGVIEQGLMGAAAHHQRAA